MFFFRPRSMCHSRLWKMVTRRLLCVDVAMTPKNSIPRDGWKSIFLFFFLPGGSTYFHITCNSNSFLWKLKQLNAWEKKKHVWKLCWDFEKSQNWRKNKKKHVRDDVHCHLLFFFSQSKWKKNDKNGNFLKNNNLVDFSKSSWSANMPYEFIRPQRNIFDELKIAFRIPKTQALDSPLKCCGSVRRLCENTLRGKKWMSWKNTSTEDHT